MESIRRSAFLRNCALQPNLRCRTYWHVNGGDRTMLANYQPLNDDPHVPKIVRVLRQDFDDRLMDLYKKAVLLVRDEPITASETVHVPYESHGLHVIAVFHEPTSHFTQLIARSAQEQGLERPSYTISLFLTSMPPERHVL